MKLFALNSSPYEISRIESSGDMQRMRSFFQAGAVTRPSAEASRVTVWIYDADGANLTLYPTYEDNAFAEDAAAALEVASTCLEERTMTADEADFVRQVLSQPPMFQSNSAPLPLRQR